MSIYQDLDAKLHDNRFKPPKPIDKKRLGGNKLLVRAGEDIHLRYHQTNVLTFRPNGTVTLNNGGWDTITTKRAMNDYLGDKLNIWSLGGEWYVDALQTERFSETTHWREEIVWTHPVTYRYVNGIAFDVETGMLVWNPNTWEPMEYVEGMMSRPVLNRLSALESAIEEAVGGRRELDNDFIEECLHRRESVEDTYKAMKQRLEHEVKTIEWRLETTLERTMKAFEKAVEIRRHEAKVKREGWCSACSAYGHSDDSPHQIDMEGVDHFIYYEGGKE